MCKYTVNILLVQNSASHSKLCWMRDYTKSCYQVTGLEPSWTVNLQVPMQRFPKSNSIKLETYKQCLIESPLLVNLGLTNFHVQLCLHRFWMAMCTDYACKRRFIGVESIIFQHQFIEALQHLLLQQELVQCTCTARSENVFYVICILV